MLFFINILNQFLYFSFSNFPFSNVFLSFLVVYLCLYIMFIKYLLLFEYMKVNLF